VLLPGDDRIVYSITDSGRQALQTWLDSKTDIDLDWRNESFLKVMLAHQLARRSPGTNGVHVDPLAVLAAERRAYMQKLSEIQADRAEAERAGKPLAALLMFDLAVMRLDAFYKWLEHCEEALAKEGGP
jgi:DNA-binding PadR family transcriptional regulator